MKLLFVDCCISQRGEESRTHKLAEAYLKAYLDRHPEAELETVFPEELLELAPFDVEMLEERESLAQSGQFDDHVVAAPYWDMSYPAALKVYIEHISAVGLTYHYEMDGVHGDCEAQHLVYLTTGGDFEHEDSLGVLHWRQLCRLFGIERFEYVFAGGLDIDPAMTPDLMEGACGLARKLAETI